jgi:hypothetical protein
MDSSNPDLNLNANFAGEREDSNHKVLIRKSFFKIADSDSNPIRTNLTKNLQEIRIRQNQIFEDSLMDKFIIKASTLFPIFSLAPAVRAHKEKTEVSKITYLNYLPRQHGR